MNHHIPRNRSKLWLVSICFLHLRKKKVYEFIHFTVTRKKHSIWTIVNDSELTFDGLGECRKKSGQLSHRMEMAQQINIVLALFEFETGMKTQTSNMPITKCGKLDTIQIEDLR